MIPKLIMGLQSLSRAEWGNYSRYLLSQTKVTSDYYRCFELLSTQKSTLGQFEANTWRKVHMDHMSEKAFLNMLSKLYLWLEEYVVYKNVKNDEIRSGIELVKHWNRAGLYKLADSKAKKVQSLLDQQTLYSPEITTYQHQLYYYQFYSDNPIKTKDPELVTKLIDSYLQSNTHHQTMYTAQLEHWNNIKAMDQKIYNRLQSSLTSKATDTMSTHLLKMVREHDVDSFYYCLKQLQNGQVSKRDDFQVLLTMYVLMYAERLWHLRVLTIPDYIVDAYLTALNNEVLLLSGKIPEIRFYTIVNTLGPLKTFDWTNNFIEKWGGKVITDDVPGVKLFAKANNYFYHNHYTEAHATLSKIKTKLINSRSIIHELAVMLYYETRAENYDLLITALDRYRSFLRRRASKQNATAIKKSVNFIRTVHLLLKETTDTATYEKCKPTRKTKWITAKIKEMSQ